MNEGIRNPSHPAVKGVHLLVQIVHVRFRPPGGTQPVGDTVGNAEILLVSCFWIEDLGADFRAISKTGGGGPIVVMVAWLVGHGIPTGREVHSFKIEFDQHIVPHEIQRSRFKLCVVEQDGNPVKMLGSCPVSSLLKRKLVFVVGDVGPSRPATGTAYKISGAIGLSPERHPRSDIPPKILFPIPGGGQPFISEQGRGLDP